MIFSIAYTVKASEDCKQHQEPPQYYGAKSHSEWVTDTRAT